MKKKIILIFILLLIGLITIFIILGMRKNYYEKTNPKLELGSGTKITMYYETTENSGDYEEVVKNEWPTEGYVFNSDISYCENGSELSWQNNKVVVKAYVKDNCYVYFDKYEPVYYWNDNYNHSNYVYPNMPQTTYATRELLTSNSELFSSHTYYIKTTSTEHQACLYYNNNDFCLGINYWDTDASTTVSKLQLAMERALQTSANENGCSSDENGAWCRFGSYKCITYLSGSATCGGWPSTTQDYCTVNADSVAMCTKSAIK